VEQGRFPEIRELKQIVRDRIARRPAARTLRRTVTSVAGGLDRHESVAQFGQAADDASRINN